MDAEHCEEMELLMRAKCIAIISCIHTQAGYGVCNQRREIKQRNKQLKIVTDKLDAVHVFNDTCSRGNCYKDVIIIIIHTLKAFCGTMRYSLTLS